MDASPTVTNCTFADNSGFGYTGGNGGVMYNSGGSSPTMTNCIFWGNHPDTFGGPGTPVVSYCNVEGGYGGQGNMTVDPVFVDPDAGDYHLSPGSPCTDAGDNTAVPEDITTDLDGSPRVVDDPDTPDCQQAPGTCGDPPVVDMGAYEFQPPQACPWDCGDGDGSVDIDDIRAVIAQWGTKGTCDFDGGGVGINDFLAVIANWGVCP